MKTCAGCGKPLPTSLDEFGDSKLPVCQDCFLKGVNPGQETPEEEINRLEILRANVQCDLEAQRLEVKSSQEAIDQCKDGIPVMYLNRLDTEDRELYRLKQRLGEIDNLLYWAKERIKTVFQTEQKRLEDWKAGRPIS